MTTDHPARATNAGRAEGIPNTEGTQGPKTALGIAGAPKALGALSAGDIDRVAQRSLAVIRAGQAPSGAWIAAPTFPTYRFSWFRDGAFIADAMSRVGDVTAAERFFDWCAMVLRDRRDRIEAIVDAARTGTPSTDHLHTRYLPDGTDSTTAWENHQLDGFGTWIWAVDQHARRHDRSTERWRDATILSAEYIAALQPLPCYDWWEEHPDERHPSTLAAVWAGLRVVAADPATPEAARGRCAEAARTIERTIRDDAARLGHVTKSLGGDTVDASLIAVSTPFGLLAPDGPVMRSTVARIETDLVHEGGVHRYLADVFYGGGEWPLLAAFLGWHRLRVGDRTGALAQLGWIVRHSSPEDDLPEQVAEHLLAPAHLAPWIDRWGPSACPLLWSHAMFLTLGVELGLVPPDLAAPVAA